MGGDFIGSTPTILPIHDPTNNRYPGCQRGSRKLLTNSRPVIFGLGGAQLFDCVQGLENV